MSRKPDPRRWRNGVLNEHRRTPMRTVTLDDEAWEKLTAFAEACGESRSWVLQELVKAAKKPPPKKDRSGA